jgi:hypothetical protein
MLNPEDDIGVDAVALPRRNIFAPPAGTSTRGLQSAHNVFDQAADERANRLTDQDDDPWAARAAWLRHLPGVARLVLCAIVVGTVVVILAARRADDAAAPAPKRPPAQATPTQGQRAWPSNGPTPAARETRPRSTRSKATRRRPEPSNAHRRRTARSPRVTAPSPTPVPVPPRATPQAPRPAEKPAPVPPRSPPEFM